MRLCCELFNLWIYLRKPRNVEEMHTVTYRKCHQQCLYKADLSDKSSECDYWESLIESCTEFSRNQTKRW